MHSWWERRSRGGRFVCEFSPRTVKTPADRKDPRLLGQLKFKRERVAPAPAHRCFNRASTLFTCTTSQTTSLPAARHNTSTSVAHHKEKMKLFTFATPSILLFLGSITATPATVIAQANNVNNNVGGVMAALRGHSHGSIEESSPPGSSVCTYAPNYGCYPNTPARGWPRCCN